MIKLVKGYLKWKLSSLIKSEIIHYTSEMETFSRRQNEWTNKTHTSKYLSLERFEQERQRQIKWSYDQYLTNLHKRDAAKDILRLVESL